MPYWYINVLVMVEQIRIVLFPVSLNVHWLVSFLLVSQLNKQTDPKRVL